MKKFLPVLMVLLGFALLLGCDSSAPANVPVTEPVEDNPGIDVSLLTKPKATASVPVTDNGVVVYYFYTDDRCKSCIAIENYTREALQQNFPKELAAGQIEFRAINTDRKENAHFLKDYNLYTKSVVISKISGGKEVEYKNLEAIWQYLGSEEKFYKYVAENTKTFFAAKSDD